MRTTALQKNETNTERASPRYKSSVSAYRDHYFTWLSIFFLALLTVMTATALRAQSVNDGYTPILDLGAGNSGYAGNVLVQPDGKALVSGGFTRVNGVARGALARLNHDGTLDTSFVATTYAGSQSYVDKFALQPDGKIVVTGRFDTFNGVARNNITRLNADGSTDTTFNPGAGVDGYIQVVVIQADGRIVVGGENITSANGLARNGIARLNANGSADASFDIGSGFNAAASVNVLLVQPDGKIIVGGVRLFSFNGVSRGPVFRLNANGSIDTSFNSGSGFVDGGSGIGPYIYRAALQQDGRVVVQGGFASVNGVARNNFARLNRDGSLDTSFDVGAGENCCVRGLTLLKNGQVLVVGDFAAFNGQQELGIGFHDAVRLNTNGSVDRSFHIARFTPTSNNGILLAAAEQSDGSILIAGNFSTFYGDPHAGIVRVNAAGEKEISYADPFGRRGTDFAVQAMAHEANGSVLIAGGFNTVDGTNNTARKSIARLDASSLASEPFNAGTGGNGDVYAIAIDRSGKVLIGGYFTTFDGSPHGRIARLNVDGSVDTSFTQIVGAPDMFNAVTAIVVQPDNKIIVGGRFTSFGGAIAGGIVRLNQDGSLDGTFNAGTGANGDVSGVALQPDGRIVITGSFLSVNGVARRAVARLNANGSVDTSFNATGLTGYNAGSLVLRPDGRMVVSIAKTNVVALRGFNANGGADPSFGTTNFSGDFIEGNVFISSLSLQADGRLIVGGAFTIASGLAANNIVRLEGDGTRDTSFSANTDGIVYSTVLQPDGRLLMGGEFTTINGVARKHVGRLSATSPAFFEFQNLGTNGMQWVQAGTAPALTDVHFDYSNDSVNWLSFESLGLGSPSFVNGAWRIQPWTITENFNFYVRGRARGAESNNADSRIGGVQIFYVRPVPVNAYTLTVTSSGVPGGGLIIGAGLTCNQSVCTGRYAPGTVVTLIALASAHDQFAGWQGGGCSGISRCTVTMNADAAVGAAFAVSPSRIVPNDFNGDGKSDLLFHSNNTGELAGWLMDGPAARVQALLLGPSNWTVTHTADFNNDGKADVLLRNVVDGTVDIWLKNGLDGTLSARLLTPNTGWSVSHTGDFNGDGKADILLRHDDGRIVLWLMDGVNVLSGSSLLPAGTGYSAVHVANFSGHADGTNDILLRNANDGTVVLWTVNNGAVTAGATILGANSGYTPIETGDFNGDGKADILWRNDANGSVVVWLMNGSTNTAGATLRGPSDWYVNLVADFDGDGKKDILLRNVDGRVELWLMNGTSVASGAIVFSDTQWAPAETGDYNGDGKADIIMRKNDGTMMMLLMNGTTVISGNIIFGAGPWVLVPPQ
jgi:uncharacterized delta-60 repeat protein